MKKLVIVESPAKAKTIGKILGADYAIFSSMGHVIDLPRRKLGVDIENNFTPSYAVIPGKKKTLAELKKEAKKKTVIYLATDPDREGEAISWHLQDQLKDKKNKQEFFRVVFHEITPQAIKESFAHPHAINSNKVNAQQARRILDRIVGYHLSPLLWKKVASGLSAGRVQSVALKLIVDKEREIQDFKPQEYWQIEAELKRREKDYEVFKARVEECEKQKIKIENKEAADKLLEELRRQEFSVSSVDKKEKKRNAYAPFITSSLQQDAFNKLKFTAHKTMIIAQQLYEGIEVGEEAPIGLITYMRTDSVKIADSALAQIRKFIQDEYGQKDLPDKPNFYKSRRSAQEAHEAIRPTSITRTPEQIKEFLSPDQYKLYDLVWKRTVASQMNPANYLSVNVEITAGKFLLTATGSVLLFDGFLKVYQENVNGDDRRLPELRVGEFLDLLSLEPSQHFTRPPARYSEASLVKALEEDGIGRPSTYAPIIYTLVIRNYVSREKGYLKATELGMKVNDILVEYFPNIIDEAFTAIMEEELDKVEEGELDWVKVLKDFYTPFQGKLDFAKENIKKEVITTDQICEKCGKPMVIKWSKQGKFLSCSGFPECRNAKSITSGIKCPETGCGGELVVRRSRRGMFYGCSNYPKCRHISNYPLKSEKSENAGDEKSGE